jgi:hypothetical protein
MWAKEQTSKHLTSHHSSGIIDSRLTPSKITMVQDGAGDPLVFEHAAI